MDYENCSCLLTQTKVVVKENRSSFCLNNEQRLTVERIQVDGCLIKDGLRCDWILAVTEDKKTRALFVELKGCDIDHGILQLEETLSKTSERFESSQRQCYIVSSRVPKYGPSVQQRAKKFFRKNRATLSIKNLRAIEQASLN